MREHPSVTAPESAADQLSYEVGEEDRAASQIVTWDLTLKKIVVSFRRSWIVVWSFELLCSIRRSWFIGGTIFTNLASHLPQKKIIGLLRRSWIVS